MVKDMKTTRKRIAAPLLCAALFVAPSSASADVRPYLWSCTGKVTLNEEVLVCETVNKTGIQLKADDVVTVTSGRAVVTGWDAEVNEIKGEKKSVRIAPEPKRTTTMVVQLAKTIQVLFGGTRQQGLLKGGNADHATSCASRVEVLQPGDLVVTSWKGTIKWRIPSTAALILRATAAGGAAPTEVRLLDGAAVDLASLRLGNATAVTMELLWLDSRPAVLPSYARLPPAALIGLPGQPVRAILTTKLSRKSSSDLAREDQILAKEIKDLPFLEQVAVLAFNGRLVSARSMLSRAMPEGVPEPWLEALSGVSVQIVP